PEDVNGDGLVAPLDALMIVNRLPHGNQADGQLGPAPPNNHDFVDVNADSRVSPLDALLVINRLGLMEAAPSSSSALAGGAYSASFNTAEQLGPQNLLTDADVQTLLERASQASPSHDAIIAVVDRTGRILGVRVEAGVDAGLQANPNTLAFAIDGAVAKARTAAFFSSNAAPLTSRTIRNISQSTMTQREVESAPNHANSAYRGPGFVAPIGVGGHFPPEVSFTPQVDLFAIEHQSRDSQFNAGLDGVPGNADDFALRHRFNVDPNEIAMGAQNFFGVWPESYGRQSGTAVDAQARGIGTLPGGIPLFKIVKNAAGVVQKTPGKTPDIPDTNLVGGIGVFFPGRDGFATFEQGFVHSSLRGNVPQTEFERMNAPKALEAEFIALVSAAGIGMAGPGGLLDQNGRPQDAFVRNLGEFTNALPQLPDFVLPTGRIDLAGITLEIYGPTPNRDFRIPGIDRLIQVGRSLGGPGASSGTDRVVQPGFTYLAGQAVPEEWLIMPHASNDGTITAAQVEQMIRLGIAEADQVRAAIRLVLPDKFRPGARTKMVLAVTDTTGEVLGLFRMKDATIFSIDVSIAKARNTAYYTDKFDLQLADQIDFNGDGTPGNSSQSLDRPGDSVPAGTSLTNRTFRFLVEPRYPTGIELPNTAAVGLVNDATRDLCAQRLDTCLQVGPQSILRMPGINPLTAENLDRAAPLDRSVYADPNSRSVLAFTAFSPSRNFRDPGDVEVKIIGLGLPDVTQPLANQNGVVFFPGSTSVHVSGNLVGGFGVSGDGVDQDDVVTAAGQVGFEAPLAIRVDQYVVGGVRLPFQKYNRNPRGR
ncbi:MAG TPA: dockerin type I domain-containing protein, partial [Pirellulaceae bacterium]